MILGLKKVTLNDCIKMYKHGCILIVSNGKVLTCKKNGTSTTVNVPNK